MKRLFFAVLVAALGTACGGSSSDNGNNNNNNSSGTCTLSGAVTASLKCNASAISDSTGYSMALGSSDAGNPSGSDSVTVILNLTSAIQTGVPYTFSTTSVKNESAGVTDSTGGNIWTASSSPSPAGSVTVTFSSITATGTSGGVTGYSVHGTASATLVPLMGGSTSNVTLSATF